MSDTAHEAREKFVATRLEYGIDEKTRAHAQMPVFTLPKPNTDARRVLFDNSANNELNMIHAGVQLATPAERVQFLKDARRLSSIDLASFFTTIRLAEDVRDFWCYRGGSHGHIRTARMVQGNSESPAIAQSFIEHVLGQIPELEGKLLMYIDNIYLKATTDNLEEHLLDLGHLVQVLAKYNLLFNVSKSVFAATDDVAVLGDLLMPTSIPAIRRMAGGVNAISAHLNWVQAALLPFYQKLGKQRLTPADIVELKPAWHDLKQCLLDTRKLYIPSHGAPLMLRVDAAVVRSVT
ncbi:hypothetical protein H4S08_004790 [Coemansia sp. RSA 1365]|nr:hypothetical protein H4S08_004790 [Coemansia sp. RSA 1365]